MTLCRNTFKHNAVENTVGSTSAIVKRKCATCTAYKVTLVIISTYVLQKLGIFE